MFRLSCATGQSDIGDWFVAIVTSAWSVITTCFLSGRVGTLDYGQYPQSLDVCVCVYVCENEVEEF